MLASHKSFMLSMNIPINEEYDDLHTFLYFILDNKTSPECLYRLPVLRFVQQNNCLYNHDKKSVCRQRDYNYNMTKYIHVAASIKCGYWKKINTLWIILILVLFLKFHIFTHLTFLNITLPFLMENKLNLRLNEIIHKSFYWKAMLQVYSFWSNINLFCHVKNERLKVLHRKLSHQYVGVHYR